MRSVLGIDAAWSNNYPNGVALLAEREDGWHLVKLANSYERFLAFPEVPSTAGIRPRGSPAETFRLLHACTQRIGNSVDVIAVDMPLSHAPMATWIPHGLASS
jgi:hypothetical protein